MKFNVGDSVKMNLEKIIKITGNRAPSWYRKNTYIIIDITNDLDMNGNKIVQLDNNISGDYDRISTAFIEIDLKHQRKRKLHDIYLHQNI